ncbi:hypothetical protein LDO26_00050 [Luteimonas sp. BDR2-5]|uniref:abortive infection system antitoxin AbiGi family protein n=1 Tax=Proluteimonas luteida TaxID=2878685 RepID=UPI001E5E2D8C|nr:abortive infection system antitoxin AbiGi family protein [Luteimonas sp. BDR2-5]MCD9026606.1 hypothetical protein [Luteimonas sp. BDR2-5]
MRSIDDILLFRGDISPFLVHLTKRTQQSSASDVLERIIRDRKVKPGASLVSDIRFGGFTNQMEEDDLKSFFGATCFTETPLDEIHCLLEVQYRNIDLEPYGLVFLKNNLAKKAVSPVLYLNNEAGDKSSVAQELFRLTETNGRTAEKLLPLFAVFGEKIRPLGAQAAPVGRVDFRWEREWRQPYHKGGVEFAERDVFVGLCPNEEIDAFEAHFPGILFVDPRRPMKWYATKLIDSRQRLDIKASVV